MEGLGLEVLVLSLCLGDYKCDQASKAYYYQRPHIRATAKSVKRDINYYVGENVAYTTGALILLSTGHKAQIKISRNFSLQWAKDVQVLKWVYSF